MAPPCVASIRLIGFQGRKNMGTDKRRAGTAISVALTACACTAVAPRFAYAQVDPDHLITLPLDSLLDLPVSTAARYAQTTRATAASVTLITSDDIARYGYRTLDEVLQSVRGFYTSNDRNYIYTGIRGFGRPGDFNNRILVMVDGHRVNEGVYGGAPIGTDLGVAMKDVERIEIVRGPGSALYGTSAVFAVIDIMTKSGRMLDGVDVAAEIGAHGRRSIEAVAGGELPGGLDVKVAGGIGRVVGRDIYFPEFDDAATNNGIARDLDWDHSGHLRTAARLGGLTLRASATSRTKGIPTASYASRFNDAGARSQDDYRSLTLSWASRLSPDKEVVLTGWADQYIYRGEYPGSEIDADSTDGHRLGTEAQFIWDLRAGNRLIFGAEARRNTRADYRAWGPGGPYFVGDFPFDAWSAFAQDEIELGDRVTVIAGVRHDRYAGRASASPRASLIFMPNATSTLKLLFGEAFRAPNVYERTYWDDSFTANPGLAPERIRTLEATWQQRVTRASFAEFSLYRYDMRDLIDTVEDTTTGMFGFANIDRIAGIGAELDLTVRLSGGAASYLNYTMQRARDARTDERLTNSPARLAKAGLSAPLAPGVDGALEVRYESSRTTLRGTRTSDVLLGRLNVRAIAPLGLHVTLLVDNLLNTAYATPAGFEHVQTSIPQDGRTVSIRLERRF